MTELQELLARVESATGPDRQLDAAIALEFGLPQEFFGELFHKRGCVDGPDCWPDDDPHWAGGGKHFIPPMLTASIDAAVSLCERVLPGCEYRLAKFERCPCEAEICEQSQSWDDSAVAFGTSLPFALCAAILRAKIAMRGEMCQFPYWGRVG